MTHFRQCRIFSSIFLVGLFLGLVPQLSSQGIQTGKISGTVTDSSGGFIQNATIVVTDTLRGTSFTTTSQSDGNYNFQALPVSQYTVTITSPGFAVLKIPLVIVTSGNDRSLGTQGLIAGASAQIEVKAGNNADLNTTQSQVSTSFGSEQLESLPLGNGFDEVALLVPGVVQTHDLSFSNQNGASFSSNGARGRANNFELDGQSNNDNSVAGPQIFFGNQDAIEEIQVVQSNFSAQYGRNTGSVVNYITKSGTNSIHGSGFEFYTGSFLSSYPNQDKNPLFGFCPTGTTPSSANPCSAVQVLPRSVDNKYGATLGGPIIRDKLFAFGSTYFEHTRNGTQPFNSGAQGLTPTPAGLATLASTFPNNAAVAVLKGYGPYGVTIGNPQPVLALATTESVIGPNGQAVDVQVAPVTRTAPSGNLADQEDLGRLDWQATSRDRFFVRYLYQKNVVSNEPDGAPAGTFYDVPDATHSVGADLTHIFSARWIDQLRYSFQQSKLDFQGGSLPNCTVNNLTACPGNITFGGSDLGFGEATNLPQGRTVKVTQVQDNANFTKGRQTILFGGEFDYQNSPNVFLPNYNGAGSFADLNSFIHQTGNFSLATGSPLLPFTERDFALYFQDDFKASSSLTINMGLRWEFFGQAINKLHDLTVARESNPATAIWNTSLPLASRTTPTVKSAFKNFEPRLGFALNPDFDKKLVIRGGYSIGFDPAFYNIFLNAATVAPVATSGTFACSGTCLGSGDFTGAGLRATNLSRLPIGGNPALSDQDYVPTNFHNPYLETYSLGVEHQITHNLLFVVRYVGTHGVGLFQNVDANPDLAPVQAAFAKAVPVTLCTTAGAPGTAPSALTGSPTARPNCNLGNVSLITNSGFSIYNSLQTQITTSNFHGLTGSVNYTFSHSTDNSSEIYSTGAGGNTIAVAQNPLDTDNAERGTSGFSLPHNLSIGMTYTTPKVHFGNHLVDQMTNGFKVNGIYQASSGQSFNLYQPLLPLYGLDGSYCDNTFNSSTVGPGADSCRLVLSNKSAPLQTVAILQGGVLSDLGTGAPTSASATHWIVNNSDISKQLGNAYPGSGRNILRAQTYNNLDASIFKDTKIKENLVVELQLNVYNALNRQFRGTPLANAFYDSGTTGPANPFLSNAYNNSEARQGIGTRNVQLGAKVRF
jgi:hypothetical protein